MASFLSCSELLSGAKERDVIKVGSILRSLTGARRDGPAVGALVALGPAAGVDGVDVRGVPLMLVIALVDSRPDVWLPLPTPFFGVSTASKPLGALAPSALPLALVEAAAATTAASASRLDEGDRAWPNAALTSRLAEPSMAPAAALLGVLDFK